MTNVKTCDIIMQQQMEDAKMKGLILAMFVAMSFFVIGATGKQVFEKCTSCYGGGKCSLCNGSGKTAITEQKCGWCDGSGRCKSCNGLGGKWEAR